jgi:predicted RNA-binding protein with PUA-like domain
MNYWLIKSEPDVYSFEQLKADKKTAWTGVRNYAARNNLRAMKKGDVCLFYHSNEGRCIVGTAKVVKEAYQDPTTPDVNWVCVDVQYDKKFKNPITLEQIKSHAVLKGMQFVKIGRLSVSVVAKKEFDEVCKLVEITNS